MKRILFLFMSVLLFSSSLFAGANEELLDSANSLKEILRVNKIPTKILLRSKAIVVIPSATKIGFFIGGEFGNGVASIRKGDGSWSNPFFVKLQSGSLGWQFGYEHNSVLLIFNSTKSVNSLLSRSITMGADASVSAGPLAKTFEKNSKINLSAEVYAYRKSEGLFLGVSLKGAVINQDLDRDIEYYGNGIKAAGIVAMPQKHDSYAIKEFFSSINTIQ
ncbi:MAG: lipid-binding SYLF domain-containing protein [Sulfurospirillum sp.]